MLGEENPGEPGPVFAEFLRQSDDGLKRTTLPVGDHRSSEGLRLERNQPEVLIGSEQQRATHGVVLPQLRIVHPPAEIDGRTGEGA